MKGSCLHGVLRRIELKKFKTFRQQVTWLGRYHSGRPSGHCWEWREGGGWITGEIQRKTGEFSGEKITFLFPDLEIGYFGHFVKGVMVDAVPALIESVNFVDGIPVPNMKVVKGAVSVGYCKSTLTSVGALPLVKDPYEERMCEVRRSQVEGGGEGLYAKRNISKGEVVAFYNGVRLPYKPGEKVLLLINH